MEERLLIFVFIIALIAIGAFILAIIALNQIKTIKAK